MNINNININIINKASLFPKNSKEFKKSRNNGTLREKIMNSNKKELKNIKTNIKEGYIINSQRRIKINNKIV